MKRTLELTTAVLVAAMMFCLPGCQQVPTDKPVTQKEVSPAAQPSPSSTVTVSKVSQITLPVLDALLEQPSLVTELKSKLQLSDDQMESLRRVAFAEVKRLREANAEQNEGDTEDARTRALDRISEIVGDEKAKQLASIADEFWAKTEGESTDNKIAATGPNAVPVDTRVVVNIPAFRMDLFQDGKLIKSYKIGIGYPEFPLPQGLRKAQSIIFNPTWTPPDSPWVATMKDVSPGELVEAGSKLNPLGPIKIPIGAPSLIHGGKPASKIGRFASHGCVGLTNAQVKDFAKLLAQASSTEVSDQAIASFLQDKTRTRVVKLHQAVPVELRYETIVVEDGKLHIFKDVYNQNTNTEENLRKVLEAQGVSFENFSVAEKEKVLAALNAMSVHPKKVVDAKTSAKNVETKSTKNAKGENVVEIGSVTLKGYPAPVNLDTGSGTSVVAARTDKNR